MIQRKSEKEEIAQVKVSKFFLIIVILASLAGGGFYLYQNFIRNNNRNALELVSADAIFVFETREPVLAWNQLVTQPIWQRLSELPSVKNAEKQLLALDSLVGRSGNLDKSLKGNQMVISLHPVGKEEFDFMFSIAFSEIADRDFVTELEQSIPSDAKIVSRSYGNVRLFEFQSSGMERTLTYAMIDNVLVASYTSFLVEEAVRFSEDDPLPNFRDAYNALFDELPQSKGLGVFRVTSGGISKFVEIISRDGNLPLVKSFSNQKIAANLELKFAENKILLTGMSFFANGSEVDFTNQSQSKRSPFTGYISNRSSTFIQYKSDSPEQIGSFRNEGFQFISTLKGDIEKKLIDRGFTENLKDGIGLMVFETINKEALDKIVLLKTDSLSLQLQLLKEFNSDTQESEATYVPIDYYMNREIFTIAAEEFPAHLFDGKFVGFDDTFVTGWDDLLVFANSTKAMKLFLDDLNSDNIWSKSLQQKNLLEDISREAGFSLLVNVPRFWNNLVETSSPNWKAFFQKYAPQLKSINKFSLQVKDNLGNNQVTLELGYNLQPIKSVQDVVLTENQSVKFQNNLIYGPQLIQNFIDRSTEFAVQDELNELFLHTAEGELTFNDVLDGPIVSEIYQIDYYKNGKLQLLFATANQVYIFDRLGNAIPGFPIRPVEDQITHLNLVDYDNNKDYRFFVATAQGYLVLMDKNGNPLEGWNPKKIRSGVTVKPAHQRIAGVGDQMVVLANEGNLYLFNRKGEPILGSPIRIGEGLNSDYIILERGSARQTQLLTITKEGEVVQVNFQGELTYRNQLLRPDRDSKFALVKDQNANRYVFAVKEYNKISILDADYNLLFSKEITADQLDFQFFSFGSDKNIFVVIDPIQEFVYLYNLKGELLNTRPINGRQKIEMVYSGSKNEYQIYTSHNNIFSEYKLPL